MCEVRIKSGMDTIGKRLRRFRLRKGLTQSEVARLAGLSPSTYRDWEYGTPIKGEPYLKLAMVLEVSLLTLMTGAPTQESALLEHLRELDDLVQKIRKTAVSSER